MIRFEQVFKRYPGGNEALSGISFEVPTGTMAFLTGHSGAGKSTILRLIALLERPSSGQVFVNQRNLNQLGRQKIPEHRRNIGIIFQDHKLLPDRTVFDNVALPLLVDGLHYADIGRRVRAALDKVGLLKYERSLPLTLSGGEQQRVGIARAIVRKPKLILADEPTGNLDPYIAREVMHLFEQFNTLGVTLFIASHDWGLISRLRHPILRLREGQMLPDDEF